MSQFQDISVNGLCNVFASKIAEKNDLPIFMAYHQNPEWDYEDQTPEETQAALNRNEFMIIHCIIADKSGDCFDANGYIYDYDLDKTLNCYDYNFYNKLTNIILEQCEHGNEDTDPITIDEVSATQLAEKIQNHASQYQMNKLSDILDESKIPDYLHWINTFQPTE